MRFPLLFSALILAALTAFQAGESGAAGFALKEQSAAALGNAFAGATAAAEDVTYMFFNPAALGRLEKSQKAGVLSFIAPQSEFQGGSASTFLGTPISGTQDHDDAAQDAFIPALYGVWAATDQLRLGLGINVPFGLETDYDEDWIGRYHGVHSELMTVNINPVVAYRVHPMVSVAVGFQAQYADAKLSNAVDFHTISVALGQIPADTPRSAVPDGFSELEGDDWGFGWNAGILFEPRQGTRLGAAYRSQLSHTLEGEVDFSGPAPFQAVFPDTDAEADLTTPETVSFGAYHEITPQVAVMAEAAWTRWSRFDELRVRFDSGQPDNVTVEDWDDSWFYALGVTFRPAEALTLRTGVAHDQTPVPDATRTPRIPDGDRTWLAVGLGWQATEHLFLDAGYTHIWVEDTEVNIEATQPGEMFRGDLTADYENSIDIVTAQLVWKF